MVFLTKQYLDGYHNVVSASQESQVQNKSSSRHYMKVYTLQQEEKEREKHHNHSCRVKLSGLYQSD